MNFLLRLVISLAFSLFYLKRKRINNRRWFLKKKLNDEAVAVHAEEVRASKRAKITETQTEEDSHSSESKATHDSFDSPE